MAGLLGGEYCISSLRQDVKDLQTVLEDVQSRVGMVKHQSWKFPDKLSCDVDIMKLLESCHYNADDAEECQMSHVMLYDVVIDRLVYLLQSFICFNEILLNVDDGGGKFTPASSKSAAIRSMSVGLTVRKCWSRITQIAAVLQKIAKEADPNTKETALQKSVRSPDCAKRIISREWKKSPSPKAYDSDGDTTKHKDVSCDVRSISCQTSETAYATCEMCSRTQSCLGDVGRSLIDVCKAQGLPTALEDYQARYNSDIPMSCADLIRWAKYQSKDISRINRHMTSLVSLVTPLKAELQEARKAEKSAHTELGQSQSIWERKEAELREEFRRREYKIKEVERALKKKISALEGIRLELQEEADNCRQKISDLKDELLQKHRDILSLETTLAQQKEEAMEGKQYKKDAFRFKSELSKINMELDSAKEEMAQTKKRCDMEIMRNENLSQHERMMQGKHKMLLKQLEDIGDDSEKLREQIVFLEEERENALTKVDELQQAKNNDKDKVRFSNMEHSNVHIEELEFLRQTVDSLQCENKELSAAVAEYIERERVLVTYPDLNAALNPPMIQGSGDVVTDMRKQVEANQIRIKVLSNENSALMKALDKVGNMEEKDLFMPQEPSSPDQSDRKHVEKKMNFHDGPIQLWKTAGADFNHTEEKENSEGSPEALWYMNRMKSKSPSERSFSKQSSTARSKPPSGHYRARTVAPNKSHKVEDVPEYNGTRLGLPVSGLSNSPEDYRKMTQRHNEDVKRSRNVRSSFTVGTGKRPNSGRQISLKTALLKPWT